MGDHRTSEEMRLDALIEQLESVREAQILLRDYFAGQALTAIMVLSSPVYDDTEVPKLCKRAFRIADLMLEARERE